VILIWAVAILIVLVLIGLGWFVYTKYIYMPQCIDSKCFSKSIVECSRSFYLNENNDFIMAYNILGKDSSNEKCNVNVEIVQVKKGDLELASLEKESMLCSIPVGVFDYPESNILDCHGILREKIQEIVIDRMHSQILANLGKIGSNLTKVL